MSGYAKITIVGRLARDPEMRYTPSGKSVTSFSVPVSRNYTGPDGERKEETEWYRISAWGRLSEVCNNYLKKGSWVLIEGRLSTRTYVDRDGKERFSLDVTANEMRMVGDRPDGMSPAGVGAANGGFSAEDTEPDDLPF